MLDETTIAEEPIQTRSEKIIETKTVSASKPLPKIQRVQLQPAFILHRYPYKETSLLLDVFSVDYGRVSLLAKGAKRPYSALRAALHTLQPLRLSWSGKNELRTLTAAEWVGGGQPLEKEALLCGFYLSELLMKLLAREDPHPDLFVHYADTLQALAKSQKNLEHAQILRRFERILLREMGFALDLSTCTHTANLLNEDQYYFVDPQRGPRPALAEDLEAASAQATAAIFSGKILLAIDKEHYHDSTVLAHSRTLMRYLLHYHLAGAHLHTRQILLDLYRL